jgi:hypothetical protein
MEYEILVLKALTAILTARWRILHLAWVSSMPLLSLQGTEAVTHSILKDRRCRPYKKNFQERQWGFFLWKQQDWEEVISCMQECD